MTTRTGVGGSVWLIAGLCAGAGAVALPVTAEAQSQQQSGVVYLEADEVLDDKTTGRYIARGSVEARYDGRTLRADEVIYLPSEARVIASGSVTIIQDDGTVTFAEEVELSDQLTEGVIEGFSARLANNGKVGAAFATRSGGDRNVLDRAFYTACEPCQEEGFGSRPTWRLKARRVVQDESEQMIYYRNAVLEVKGVPVLYTPFFAHPDPSAERKSGFLVPSLGDSSRTGFFYEQPYYWAISESQELTIAPRIMSEVNPLINFDYRKRFYSGEIHLDGSFTSEQEFDDNGDPILDGDGTESDEELRGHLFGQGVFAINQNWSWGFGIERTSDDLYLRRYDLPSAGERRGIYGGNSARPLSQLYAVRQTQNSFSSVAAAEFQGLRNDDSEDVFPTLFPVAESRTTLPAPVIGGRVEARGSVAVQSREDGVDTARVTVEADWERQFTTKQGVIAKPFVLLRGDVYGIDNFDDDFGGTADDPEAGPDETVTRLLGHAGVTASYPLARRAGGVDVVLEPIVQAVAAPEDLNDDEIPNTDSAGFVIDDSSILEPNRSPGFDIFEDGLRATVGGRATVRWRGGQEASLFVGQSFRAEEADSFGDVAGIDSDSSDVVGEASYSFNPANSVVARFRIDDEDGDLKDFDISARAKAGPLRTRARYLRFDEPSAAGRPEEEISGLVSAQFTDHVGAYVSVVRNIDEERDLSSNIGLVYDDDCTRFAVVYAKREADDRGVGDSESIRFEFTLATLGSFGNAR